MEMVRKMKISIEKKKELLQTMLRIRLFEETVDQLIKAGKVYGTTHLYIGEEAVATGACKALEKSDYITSTHRGHGHCVAKGEDLNRMLAELLGRKHGYCHGKGGSMHIASFSDGILGANGIVGGSIGIATGAAFASKKLASKKVVVCFFGDGATNQGLFYESLNMAKIWGLPIIFLCENNLYAISMSIQRASGTQDLCRRVEGFGVETRSIDGNDVELVYQTVSDLAQRCRDNEGPFFLECKTYRTLGHSRSDNQPYRTKEEVAQWKKRDPITSYVKTLIEEGSITESEYDQLSVQVEQDMEAAQKFAENDEFPGAEDLYTGLYYKLLM